MPLRRRDQGSWRRLNLLNLSNDTAENIRGLPLFQYNSAKTPDQEQYQRQKTLPYPDVRPFLQNKSSVVFLHVSGGCCQLSELCGYSCRDAFVFLRYRLESGCN